MTFHLHRDRKNLFWWILSITIIFILELWRWLIGRMVGWKLVEQTLPSQVFSVIFVVFFAAYGFWLVVAHHPITDPRYREWLKLTPWTHSMPLPMGSPWLQWQDLLLLLPTALYACRIMAASPAWLTLGFVLAYTIGALVAAARVKPSKSLPLLVALPLVTPALFPGSRVCFIFATGLYILADITIRLTLKEISVIGPDKIPRPRAGGIFQALSPRPSFREFKRGRGIGAALLMAWMICLPIAFVSFPLDASARFVFWQISSAAIIMAALLRLACITHVKAPTSLFGRLGSGVWWFPRHDAIYIAPLLIGMVGVILPEALMLLHVPLVLAIAIQIVIVLTLATELPPTRRSVALASEGAPRVILTTPLVQRLNRKVPSRHDASTGV